jgi:CDP-diacylglycerol--serine O-phosphatidyltransferase
MTFKKHIPNIITLLNLLSGTIAVYFAVKDTLILASLFILLGIFFDFFDGLVARLLNVQGELGKQLDSLADVVTSGVAPGFILFQLLQKSIHVQWENELSCEIGNWVSFNEYHLHWVPFLGLIVTLAAAFRLAKFNIDTRQTDSFIGLPTPAAALVVLSLPLILAYSDITTAHLIIESTWFLLVLSIFLSYLMNAEIKLFSLKFKNFTWKSNKVIYFFLLLAIILVIILKVIAIPLIIFCYVLISSMTKK